jgi:23S rRNA pseudouridine2605 synthase
LVNDKIVQEMGYKVMPGDVVKCDGQTLRLEKMQYLILNKPKDFITSLKDPFHQKTVMHLVKNACKERIFPVGRLDKETTGLLLFTNDGDLAMKLTHPSMEHKKLYHVELDKKVLPAHLDEIRNGIDLEDGFVKADSISYVGEDKHQVGIEVHVGRNRIVRRIFEHYGYFVKKLDRVVFAGLTKKDLPRGKFRMLTQEEIILLKRM